MTKPAHNPIDDPTLREAAAGLSCEPAHGTRQQDALSLLLTGKVASPSPAVEQFRAFAGQNRLSLEHIWLARRGSTPVAAVLIVPSAGHTGMVFLSPVKDAQHAKAAGVLTRAACLAQSAAGTHLIQSLLEVQQVHEVTAFIAAGFTKLATLLYMERSINLSARPLNLDSKIQINHWQESKRPLFAASILASYEQTLDCPGLLGLREIDDIIAGHLSTGEFDPKLWFNLSCQGEPVGVMLLNKVPQRQALELVYLGLNPKWRGLGLSRKLLEHGAGLVGKRGMTQLILAVDSANVPALKLYRALHFVENGRKLAMIFAVKK